jgi:hypothetical protein
MAESNFLAPKFNQLIESDPQIKRVDLEYTDWGSRKSGLPGSVKNDNTIKHVK